MSEESKGGNQIYIYAPQGPSNTSTQLVPPSSKQVKSTPLKGSPSAHKTKQLNSQSIDVTKIQIQSRNHGQQEGPTSKSGGPSFKKQRSPLTGSNEAFNESGRVRYGVQLAGLNSETEFHMFRSPPICRRKSWCSWGCSITMERSTSRTSRLTPGAG